MANSYFLGSAGRGGCAQLVRPCPNSLAFAFALALSSHVPLAQGPLHDLSLAMPAV